MKHAKYTFFIILKDVRTYVKSNAFIKLYIVVDT